MKKAEFVRQLIREETFVTGADVAKDAERCMGENDAGQAAIAEQIRMVEPCRTKKPRDTP